jgi:hypothetical protein
MRAEVIVTLIGVGLLVAALVLYLSLVAYHLTKVNFTLGTVLIGVRAIANQVQPLGGVVGSIANDVGAMDDALKELVEVATTPAPEDSQYDDSDSVSRPSSVTRRGRTRVSR